MGRSVAVPHFWCLRGAKQTYLSAWEVGGRLRCCGLGLPRERETPPAATESNVKARRC